MREPRFEKKLRSDVGSHMSPRASIYLGVVWLRSATFPSCVLVTHNTLYLDFQFIQRRLSLLIELSLVAVVARRKAV